MRDPEDQERSNDCKNNEVNGSCWIDDEMSVGWPGMTELPWAVSADTRDLVSGVASWRFHFEFIQT
ncbi:hypothetical protein N7481_012227 [Penicillium waksmanii]|uniref:uncharacterized protein n=1 Tax=Penicillium waksmanii TaxID=69791 RepID=UPI002548A8C5|nr:uncharacterized protein N7481_012227 [Penicillium waksmanii]KAJ5965513.1 hypothetical protein N7481_012227 [Penicillium waksmanii]